MAGKTKVLVVEDEDAIRRGILDALKFAGYAAVEAADGVQGLARASAPGVDLVLLDLMLPGLDGFEVLAEVRKARPRLPVIILTARGAEEDRIRGLRGGADDYVVKPFSARELLARVEAVLRRSAERPNPVSRLSFATCTIDFEQCQAAFADGTSETLTPKEIDLLNYLANNPGRAVSRQEILERVWGINARGLDTRAVDMLVARLRSKLKDEQAQIVRTVRSKGYGIGETL